MSEQEPADIDLQALALKPTVIKDRLGERWNADPEMSGSAAFWFLQQAPKADPVEMLERCYKTIFESLRPHHPKVTIQDVRDRFTAREAGVIIGRFLSLTGLAASLLKAAASPSPTKKPAKRR